MLADLDQVVCSQMGFDGRDSPDAVLGKLDEL